MKGGPTRYKVEPLTSVVSFSAQVTRRGFFFGGLGNFFFASVIAMIPWRVAQPGHFCQQLLSSVVFVFPSAGFYRGSAARTTADRRATSATAQGATQISS